MFRSNFETKCSFQTARLYTKMQSTFRTVAKYKDKCWLASDQMQSTLLSRHFVYLYQHLLPVHSHRDIEILA